MNQTIRGFYQSHATKAARMTQIVGSGAPNSTDRLFFNNSRIATDAFAGANSLQSDRGWSNPTYDVQLADARHRSEHRVRGTGNDQGGPQQRRRPTTVSRGRPSSSARV